MNNKEKQHYTLSLCLYSVVWAWLIYNMMGEGGEAHVTVCPSKLLFGISCAGCGITRATIMCLNGEFMRGIAFNPNVIFSIAYLAMYPILLFADIIHGNRLLIKAENTINDAMTKWYYVVPFIIIEIIITIHNNIVGV